MKSKILIVDDEKVIRESIKIFLTEEGYECNTASNGEEGLVFLESETYDIAITDIKMPGIDGIEFIEKGNKVSPETFFIIMTAYASVDTAVTAIREGVYDYIQKPVELDQLLFRINKLLDYKKLFNENKILRQRLSYSGRNSIIGKSDSMEKIFELIEKVATTNTNVLILGKSGTGKELVAKEIHLRSQRADKIFLPVNCGAISETLIESELFGHKKGSFTGATEEKPGLFKVADGGTLFLDEIGEVPLNLQVKLLRAIEEKQFFPVGGIKPIKSNVRIIAATNKNLSEKAKNGEFREDLYYRLNVFEISLPSLEERREDIPLLVNHFVDKFSTEIGKKVISVDNKVMKILLGHNWRGGVRELQNVIERAVIFASTEQITMDDLSDNLKNNESSNEYPDSLKDAVKKFEKEHIIKIFKKFDHNKEEAAKYLNIGLSSLYRKMEELGIPTKAI